MSIKTKIADMTSTEINSYIMGDAPVDKPVAMSNEVANAILDHPCYDMLDKNLTNWAWLSIEDGEG